MLRDREKRVKILYLAFLGKIEESL